MKYLALIPICLALAGCETTNSDGSTSRFDADGATKVLNAGFQTYERINMQKRIIGYNQWGQPIYGP